MRLFERLNSTQSSNVGFKRHVESDELRDVRSVNAYFEKMLNYRLQPGALAQTEIYMASYEAIEHLETSENWVQLEAFLSYIDPRVEELKVRKMSHVEHEGAEKYLSQRFELPRTPEGLFSIALTISEREWVIAVMKLSNGQIQAVLMD